MKFYAVKKGRKEGIFDTWEECKAQVSEYSGAEFKSFKKLEEAQEYLGMANIAILEVKDKEYIIYI